ncbi:chemotaxis protein CheA, partial [Xanthomonas oryzae pv. oryzae]
MDMNQLMQTFLAESRDLLEDMERHLLEAERGESSPDAVNAIFRAAHTIKGSGGLFDLPQLVGFTHVVESVLDLVRDEALTLSSDLIGLLLVCCDHIHALVETAADPSHADPAALAAEAEPLLAQLQTYLQGCACGVTATAIQHSTPEKQSGYWRITLKLFADALRFGNSPLKLIRNLRGLGSVESIHTDISQLPAFDDLDPEANYLGFQILLRSDADRAAIEDVFEFVREDCDLDIVAVPAPTDGVALAARTALAAGAVALAAVPAVPPARAAADAGARNTDARSIRVDADKLDRMIDLVGELIIAVSSTSANAQRTGNAQLLESTSILAGLVEDVRESALQLRMVKIGGTFSRFQRVVHDVARELGKDIALVVAGEDTELDKSVVEKIGDPLTHLVRNAMDHGIEPADVRVARGKPARGT